jgi:hypothetical protein
VCRRRRRVRGAPAARSRRHAWCTKSATERATWGLLRDWRVEERPRSRTQDGRDSAVYIVSIVALTCVRCHLPLMSASAPRGRACAAPAPASR